MTFKVSLQATNYAIEMESSLLEELVELYFWDL